LVAAYAALAGLSSPPIRSACRWSLSVLAQSFGMKKCVPATSTATMAMYASRLMKMT